MFHDIGLTAGFRDSQLRFEVDGANAAEKFLRDHGFDDAAVRKVWLSIALHTTPGVPEFLDPEIALVNAGVKVDVVGIGLDDISDDVRNAVTTAHPRPDFKRRIVRAFADGNLHRPHSTHGTINADVLAHFDPTFVREDFVQVILDNGWSE
jgi:hypothetical protein